MDKNVKPEIEKNKGPPKEKEKSKEIPKDITDLKDYKVPDAINKKYFDKINNYNFIGIMKFIIFPEIVEISFVNQKFNKLIKQKYPKKIPLVKLTLKNLKKYIFFNFSEDFQFQLKKNSSYTNEIIKKLIEESGIDYFPKMRVKKYFFNKMNSNPEIKKINLENCDIGKRSLKYLSYYFDNKNCNITDIDMSGNKLTGDILNPLGKNSNIKLNNLILNKCIFDLKTFINLSNINIKKLSLLNNNIDDEYIYNLKNNNINELNIAHNYISNEGVFSICKYLPNLQKLNLANNNICDLSLLYISLYMKEQKIKLTSLNLKDNKITITGMTTLLSTLEKINQTNNNYSLKKLNLSGNLLDLVPLPKRVGTHFLNIKIEKLCVGNHSFNINDLNILLNFINNIQNITILDLSKIAFDNVSLNLIFNRVSENISLKKLKLKYCYLGNTEVNNTLENYYTKSYFKKEKSRKNNNIYKSKKNKKDEIDNNNIINENEEEDSLLFEKKESFNKIEINNKNLNNEEKQNEINKDKIINNNKDENIPNNNIDIEKKENKNENNENKEMIIDKKEIKEKNEINNNNFINESIGVESLDLGYNFINYQRLDKIILSNHIKELKIEGNDLHLWGDDIYLFFDFIIDNKVLEKLNLNNNNLQNIANKFLEKMYNFNNENDSNCSLKFLSLEDNQIKNINLELTNLLSINKNLEVLNLRKNLINDEMGNNYFFHSLFKSKFSSIKEINMSNNKISLNFIDKIIKYSRENIIEKKNFVLNVTSKEIREAYLNTPNKESYKELVKLKIIKCL